MAQQVDPRIWSACGGQPLGPAMFEKCVFLPQGLIGQCSSSAELRLLCSRLPYFGCSVVSIQYLADTITDEVYAKVVIKSPSDSRAPAASRPATMPASNTPSLGPATMPASNTPSPVARGSSAMHASNTRAPAASRPVTMPASNTRAPVASRPATMPASNTPSPASRLTILPGFIKVIDTNDLISQECTITAASLGVGEVLPKEQVSLQIRDIHRRIWTFEHRYNHILESHSLASGWRPFLDSKKLSPGDSLVFLKTEDGLTVGIRRAPRSSPGLFNMGESLSRIGSGALSVEELSEILGKPFSSNASSDQTLKFDYFPSVDSSWFVVPQDGLSEKITFDWHVGMKVRKYGMVKDQFREAYVHGTVAKVRVPWNRSFWKTLDISWDPTYGAKDPATNAWEIEPVIEDTTEERPSKKPALAKERSDTALTLFGYKLEPTSDRRA